MCFICVCILVSACVKAGATDKKANNTPVVLSGKPTRTVQFFSTQLNPSEEANKMRQVILAGFPGTVDFQPNNSSYFYKSIKTALFNDPDAAVLLGSLYSEFRGLYKVGALRQLDDLYSKLAERKFSESLLALSRFDGAHSYCVPWMQATYLLVINKKALKYLPKGVAPDTLTYSQLLKWLAQIKLETGMNGMGFPASDQGLMHRFFQGYLYPSFTGSTLAKFRSDNAVAMWNFFKDLWKYVNPNSLTYSNMTDPLLNGEVLIGWDHTARLVKLFEANAKDFIAIPAPFGSFGRGYIPVISGLAIPAEARQTADAELLAEFLTDPAVQARMPAAVGFFPVVDSSLIRGIPEYLVSLNRAVARQSETAGGIPTALPTGLGEYGDAYNRIFMLTFSDIVLGGKDPALVLEENAKKLQALLDKAQAPFWPPDKSDGKTGIIE